MAQTIYEFQGEPAPIPLRGSAGGTHGSQYQYGDGDSAMQSERDAIGTYRVDPVANRIALDFALRQSDTRRTTESELRNCPDSSRVSVIGSSEFWPPRHSWAIRRTRSGVT